MIEFEGKMCSAAEKEQTVGKNNRATKVWRTLFLTQDYPRDNEKNAVAAIQDCLTTKANQSW
jgi:hypothetical protein